MYPNSVFNIKGYTYIPQKMRISLLMNSGKNSCYSTTITLDPKVD